jgi:hypothetical protein
VLIAQGGDHGVGHAMGGANLKLATTFIQCVDRAGIGAGKLNRFGHDGGKDRFQIERRVDCLAHLAKRTELLDRTRQFSGSDLNLPFKIGVRFLQLTGHVVELIGERLELVAGSNRNSLRQIAAADPGGARAQPLDGDDHALRKQHAGQTRKPKRADKYESRPLDRSVKWRVGLVDRELDEHQPAERLDRRIGREHLPAFDVGRFLYFS